MLLNELFEGKSPVEITGIQLDSRKIKKGDIFFALKGVERDGHWYIRDAVLAGASAIVYSDPTKLDLPEGTELPEMIESTDVRGELCRVADLFYGQPSKNMTVFGVTGTNGKTTTSSIIEWIYQEYKKCGYMGTIGIRYGEMDMLPSLTTPDSVEVQQHLATMRDMGAEACAMEVSSHGLVMRRVETVDFDCAIFTNLTYDHLDFHRTMENYLDAKAMLFRNMKPSGVAVLNCDDEASFETLKKACNCHYVTYGQQEGADYRATNIILGHHSTSFTLEHQGKKYTVVTNLVAEYNVYNLLAAIAAMHEMGMEMVHIIDRADSIPQVDGRMEVISEGQPFSVIVDYAHTPDGYEKIYQYAKALTKNGGHIYGVFGCPGKRDTAKRSVMGEIAGTYADSIIVTSQDPRDSDPAEIAKEIGAGIEKTGCSYRFVRDRAEAIAEAISMAEPKDVVLLLGKGDEPYMYVGEGRDPWEGDNNIARRVLKERQGAEEHDA